MNITDWLYRATLSMPACVKERVRAEMSAHLEEANALQSTDVVRVLGSPEKFNRELRRLYLTEKDWQSYRIDASDCRWNPGEWVALLFLVVLVWAQIKGTPASPSSMQLFVWMGLVVAYSLMLLGTQKLSPVRRRQWRYAAVMLSGLAVQWPYFAEFLGFPNPIPALPSYVLLICLLSLMLRHFIQLDLKIRRTMRIEGHTEMTG